MIYITYLFFQPVFLLVIYLTLGMISDTFMFIVIGCNVSFFYLALSRRQMLDSAVYFNALIVYLLVQFVYIGVSCFYHALLLYNGYSEFRFSVIPLQGDDLLKGALLVLFADYFMFLSYFMIDRYKQNRQPLQLTHKGTIDKHFISNIINLVPFLYLGVWLLRLIPHTYLRKLGSLVVGIEQNGGNVLQLLLLTSLLFGINKQKPKTYFYIISIFIFELYYCATFGSKTRVIMLLIPFIVTVLCYLKGNISKVLKFRTLTIIFLISYFLLMIVFPINHQIRKIKLEQTINLGSVSELAETYVYKSIPFTDEFNETHYLPKNGLWRFFARGSGLAPNAVAIIFKGNDPDINIHFLETGFLMLIPRILWADKPLNMSGVKASIMISGESGNSLGFNTAGSLLLSGGVAVIIVVMLFNGVVLNLGWSFIEKDFFYNPIAMLCAFNLIVMALRLPETHDGGFNSSVKFLVLYIPLCYLSRLWFKNQKDSDITIQEF